MLNKSTRIEFYNEWTSQNYCISKFVFFTIELNRFYNFETISLTFFNFSIIITKAIK